MFYDTCTLRMFTFNTKSFDDPGQLEINVAAVYHQSKTQKMHQMAPIDWCNNAVSKNGCQLPFKMLILKQFEFWSATRVECWRAGKGWSEFNTTCGWRCKFHCRIQVERVVYSFKKEVFNTVFLSLNMSDSVTLLRKYEEYVLRSIVIDLLCRRTLWNYDVAISV